MKLVVWLPVLSIVFGGMASSADACPGCAGAYYAVMPGGGLWALWALPCIMLLNGLLERPFVSLAGVKEHALQHSIQGSVTAGLVVHAIGTVAWPASWMVPFAPLAVLVGLVALHWYLKRLYLGTDLRGGVLLVGSIVSLLAVALLPITISMLDFDRHSHVLWAKRVAPPVALLSLLAVTCVVGWAFRAGRRPRGTVFDDPRRGFDVAPATPTTLDTVTRFLR